MARAVNVFKTNMIEAERLAAEQDVARAARSRRQDAMDRHTEVFGQSVTGRHVSAWRAAGNMRRAAGVMAESPALFMRGVGNRRWRGQNRPPTSPRSPPPSSNLPLASGKSPVRSPSPPRWQARRCAVPRQVRPPFAAWQIPTARIGDVVRLIDSIAGQTNLLALNATIEAARAGDAGKGFAVVAGEVKALAAQTAKATAEIGAQIETVRGATEETVAAMNEIGGIIGRMGDVSTAISAAVEEQSVTTREIASSIEGRCWLDRPCSESEWCTWYRSLTKREKPAGHILSEAAEISLRVGEAAPRGRAIPQRVRKEHLGEQRRFERIAGNGVAATLRLPGKTAMKATISDLSRGGVALRHSGAVEVGWDAEVDLPEAGGPVTGRVVRVERGLVSISFSDTPAMLVRVDRSLASLSAARKAA